MNDTFKIGISSCLLGNRVRYDGGHKHDRFLTDTLGNYVTFVPVCPEVECGLSIPREALRLVGDENSQRLVFSKTGGDITDKMKAWANSKLDSLQNENLCGFIFKSKSPSSGMERVKIYGPKGSVSLKGRGVFAGMFMDRFPGIPVEEEGRLHDPYLRENFIERIFTLYRWRQLSSEKKSLARLIDFHSDNKLLILSHSPEIYRQMGRLVAEGKKQGIEELFATYEGMLISAMTLKATKKKNLNVLYHMMGYFKKELSGDEKSELIEILTDYAEHRTPLIVPVTMLRHYSRKYNSDYLKRQTYLSPHPLELQLRNHV